VIDLLLLNQINGAVSIPISLGFPPPLSLLLVRDEFAECAENLLQRAVLQS